MTEAQVAAAVRLLDEGATVPFIARYRKEVTGSLDDGQLRELEERLRYLRELDERRAAVLSSIEEQGKLTDELKAALLSADTKARVEDIYLPYKPKRRTKAQIAREAGLEPLADRLLADPNLVPDVVAAEFLTEASPMPTPPWTVPATFSSNGRPRTPSWWAPPAPSSGRKVRCGRPHGPRTRRKPKRHRNTATTLSSPNPWKPCPHTGYLPSCAVRRNRFCPSTSTAAMTHRTSTWLRSHLA
ncbi:tex-like N-terminal domain protein [Mycobacteroides abscessus MAB_110811_1470]|nr:tex-like N-terminal domain protein [Mycobacteroides abscessus MAB_110811_1470]